MTMLMHIDTGSVDTKENWKEIWDECEKGRELHWDEEEKGAPFKYMEFNECGSLYEVVKVNGEWFEPDAVANLMDDEIRESLHGLYEEEQELVDAYCVAHKAKFGEEFVVN